jgi:hypothetical protein
MSKTPHIDAALRKLEGDTSLGATLFREWVHVFGENPDVLQEFEAHFAADARKRARKLKLRVVKPRQRRASKQPNRRSR